MNRTDVLNFLADARRCRSYLEIGIRNPEDNYNRIRCAEKTGVDPRPLSPTMGVVTMTSDEFFQRNTRRYDLVFVDGDHHVRAAWKDIRNSLAVLNPRGIVVIHDALPPAETFTRLADRKSNNNAWTGGVWQAILRHFAISRHLCYIVDVDWGIAVIDTGAPRRHARIPGRAGGKLAYGRHFRLLHPFRVSAESFRDQSFRPASSGKASIGLIRERGRSVGHELESNIVNGLENQGDGWKPIGRPVISITRWTGRFGNNCFQLIHAVHLARELRLEKVEFPRLRRFAGQNIVITRGDNPVSGMEGDFYKWRQTFPCAAPGLRQRKEICLSYILPIYRASETLEPELKKAVGLDDSLVIHVRSGDVFGRSPHPNYVQPPLWYYRQILREQNWKNIFLVSEDMNNPVIRQMCDDFPGIVFMARSFSLDFAMLRHARNLVGSKSTFSIAAFYFNREVCRFWMPGFPGMKSSAFKREFPKIVKVVDCPGYIPIGQWRNTGQQRRMMLDYAPC